MIIVEVWAASHTGLVRERNEDCWGISGVTDRAADGVVVHAAIESGAFVAVVADGLGGHPCGDVASRLAVDTVLRADPCTADELVLAVHAANEAIYSHMFEVPETRRMGTTLAALLVGEQGITVVNVGDSAVFELIDGRPIQLTVDDTPAGSRTPPGVPSSVVTQTLGGSSVETSVQPHVYSDDGCERRFLLCTDGLTNFVPNYEIANITRDLRGEAAVDALLARALAAGGPDNVTVGLIEVQRSNSRMRDRNGDLDGRG